MSAHVNTWRSLAVAMVATIGLAACGADTVSPPTANSTAPDTAVANPAAPTISGTPATSVQAGDLYTFRPTASDPNGLPMQFQIAGKPDWATFDTGTGQITGTPAGSDVGETAEITISASNGAHSTSLAPFSIAITAAPGSTAPPNPNPPAVNTPPQISGTPATTVMAGQVYSFLPTATDADHDSLSFSITNKPAWASFSTVTGQLSGTPTKANAGTFSNITMTVNDGKATAALPPFSIVVQAPANHAPTISGTPAATVVAGSAYSFAPTASDQDGDALTFSVQNKPTWATFSTATGALSGTPASTQTGAYANIIISVSDGKASSSLAAFAISVTTASTSGAPTITGTPPTSVTAGSSYSFHPTATGASGSTLTFSIQNKPAWAAFNTSSGALTGNPAASDAGTTSNIVISVGDGTRTASLAAFSITVNQISNKSAVLNWTAPTQNVDGTALATFAGYRILYGTDASSLAQTAQIGNPTVTTYTVENLSSGTWYFSIVTYLSDGTQSSASNPASLTIP